MLIVLLSLMSTSASAEESKRPVGQNCDLAKPPESAGEEADHRALLFVFPRAHELGSNYTGCQVVWVQQDGNLALAWTTLIQRGEVVRVWSPDAAVTASLGNCLWERGVLKRGLLEKCGDSKSHIMESYLPGCFSKAPEGKFSAAESEAHWARDCGDPL